MRASVHEKALCQIVLIAKEKMDAVLNHIT